MNDIVSKGQSPAKLILRANILLASDRNNEKHMTVAEIANAFSTTPTTVQNVRTSYANNGLEATINRKKRETPPVPPKVTGDVEAHIIALACSEPPEGYSRWTVRLLADKCVELNYAESISHMTVSRVLKKTNLSLTRKSAGVYHQNTMRHLLQQWKMFYQCTAVHMTRIAL